MDKTLQIKPEFEQIIPPLSKEEFAQLEENILKLGKITDPIQVQKKPLSTIMAFRRMLLMTFCVSAVAPKKVHSAFTVSFSGRAIV